MAKKTYKKKTTARQAAGKGKRVYKVRGGWRISCGRYARHNGWHRTGGRTKRRRRRAR